MATIEISGAPQLKIDDEQISKWVGNRLNDARNRFIVSMSGIGTGATYRHGKRVFHIASNPFEYPKSDSGRLSGSAAGRRGEPKGEILTTIDNPRQGSIWSNVMYADLLESGTPTMSPRKMLGDALSEVLEQRPETDELAKAAKIE